MGKVKFIKTTTEAFRDLLDNELTNADVLYFVSDTGDFSPSSLDVDGSLYLGDKLISSPQKPSFYYGICRVAANTKAKNVMVDAGILPIATGTCLFVKFSYYNSASSPTLRINGNSTTDTAIKRYGSTAPGTGSSTSWNNGSTVCFVFDGSSWQIVGWLNTTYSDFTANANGTAGTHGLVPAPSADTPPDSVLSNQGWKDHIALHNGIHCGGSNNTSVWAKVMEGSGLNPVTSSEDFTCVILVSKHVNPVNGQNSGQVGFLIVDFKSDNSSFSASARWYLRSNTLGTPSIKLGVEIVDDKVVLRIYVNNKSWTSYGFKIMSCIGWGITGFTWRCFQGRTGTSAISTYSDLPSSANETIYDVGNDIAIAADTVPTQNSDNLITSGAVYAAIGDIETLLAAI